MASLRQILMSDSARRVTCHCTFALLPIFVSVGVGQDDVNPRSAEKRRLRNRLRTTADNFNSALGESSLDDAAEEIKFDVVRRGNREMVDLVIERGVDPTSVLHEAAKRGDSSIIEALVEAGGRLDALNADLVTPVRLAAINFNQEAYDRMLEFNAGREPQPVHANPILPEYTVEQLVEMTSKDKSKAIQRSAGDALVTRGRESVHAVLQAASKEDLISSQRRLLHSVLERIGPDAESAISELEDRILVPVHAVSARVTMNRIRPGHYQTLDARVRQAADKAHLTAVTDRSVKTHYDAVYVASWLSNKSLLVLLGSDDSLKRVAMSVLGHPGPHIYRSLIQHLALKLDQLR